MKDNIWEAGEKRIVEENIKKKRDDERKRLGRKQFIKQAIESIRLDESVAATFNEEETPDVPCWVRAMMNRYPDYYK